MKFAEKIFGKELSKISLDDLKLFFEIEREESSKIEFKSGQIAIEDIYREICAFLNTDGGILIIGTPKEEKIQINKSNYKRICKGELIPSSFRNKGWLTQKIAANISPFPVNIEIQEILTSNGNFFILDIPQSMTPPHQCTNEGKYYIRLEDEAKPAPHGIVQSLFFKRQIPQISTETVLKTYKNKPENEIEITININNVSNVPAEKVSYLINIDNIEDVKVEDYHNNAHGYKKKHEHCYIIQEGLDQVLVKGLVIPVEFSIFHKYQHFLISILVWGKDFGLYEDSCIYDPIEFKQLESFKTGDDKNITREDLINRLSEILGKKEND